MPVTAMVWRHDYRRGLYGGFHWLQSEQLQFSDFLAWMKPPTEGFRLLITAVDGVGSAYPYARKDGWISNAEYGLSPLMHSWPELVVTGNGEAAYVLDALSILPDIEKNLIKFQNLDCLEQLDDFSLPTIQQFWKVARQLNPLFYICDWRWFSLVSRSEASLAEFIEGAGFQNSESKLKDDAFATRESLWNHYWETLGPEGGPEECVHPGCDRLRIQLAIRCLRHQLESFNPGCFR